MVHMGGVVVDMGLPFVYVAGSHGYTAPMTLKQPLVHSLGGPLVVHATDCGGQFLNFHRALSSKSEISL